MDHFGVRGGNLVSLGILSTVFKSLLAQHPGEAHPSGPLLRIEVEERSFDQVFGESGCCFDSWQYFFCVKQLLP